MYVGVYANLKYHSPLFFSALTSPWPFLVWGINIIGRITPKGARGHGYACVASFKPLKSVSNSKCVELLHMVLYGPICIKSLERHCYIFVTVDDYSRFTWVIFFKDKREALREFAKLCRKLQMSKNLLVVAIRNDHGREFD